MSHRQVTPVPCAHCGSLFRPLYRAKHERPNIYCSVACGARARGKLGLHTTPTYNRKRLHALRVLPADNIERPMQVCEVLNAKLTTAACAIRYQRAEAGHVQVGVCKGCKIGRGNYLAEVASSKAQEAAE